MKTSTKLLLGLFLTVLLAITVFAINITSNLQISNSPFTESKIQSTEIRNIATFNQIECSNGMNVIFEQSLTQKVTVTTDSNFQSHVITEVIGNKLVLSRKEKLFNNIPVTITIYASVINNLDINSGCTFTAEQPIKGDNLEISVSSGSTLNINLLYNKVKANISSGSTANLSGKVNTAKTETSSGSTLNANTLTAEIVKAKASSGSTVSVNVTNELSVEANSGSTINYSGNPTLKGVSVNSGASLNKQ